MRRRLITRRNLFGMACLTSACWFSTVAEAQETRDLAFEVASVKPSPPVPPNGRAYFGPSHGGPGTTDPQQITWSYATMKNLLMTAYDVKVYQINGPQWMSAERYDVIAKVAAGATKEQVRVMWQNLLAERFGVVLHHESKDFKVEELVVAKGGPKFKETTMDVTGDIGAAGPPTMKNGELLSAGMVSTISPGSTPKARTVARAQPIAPLAVMLTNQLDCPVLDKTGLTGRYDYTLEFSLRSSLPPPSPGPETHGDNASDPGPDITSALEQQLGLRLVSSRAKLDVLVIDKAEKSPTAN
jgi:uncharacterized protein (TIGR03435 family)